MSASRNLGSVGALVEKQYCAGDGDQRAGDAHELPTCRTLDEAKADAEQDSENAGDDGDCTGAIARVLSAR